LKFIDRALIQAGVKGVEYRENMKNTKDNKRRKDKEIT
jgi:hypothetical protein